MSRVEAALRPPPVHSVHDRGELAALLSRDPALHAYELGDLDDFSWPYTTWYRQGDALALLYHGLATPTLLAFGDGAGELLTGLLPLLPWRFDAHLSPGLESVLAGTFQIQSHEPHVKMALTDPARLSDVDRSGEVLTVDDLPELTALYEAAYPGNWFDQRMLATDHYIGVRRDGALAAVAGVHVWSPTYRVSTLGNVTTHPRSRGLGLATTAVATLCRRLLTSVDHIGLNVHADNAAAIAVYTRLGFTTVAHYTEFSFTVRSEV
jgi:ribosomal protein S18 acetylase RimI-like enzyme